MNISFVQTSILEIKTILELVQSDLVYTRYYYPFNLDFNKWKKAVYKAELDKYFTIIVDGVISGCTMLRGLDEGYENPMFGLFIDKEYAGIGLGTLALQHSYLYCKKQGYKQLLLTVHPDNIGALRLYKDFGFRQINIEDDKITMRKII